ncbi:MAG: hypothetical protein WCS43_12295 [Verrucomicrobiota bacterium]
MDTPIENTAAPSVEVPRLVLPLAVTYRELHEDAAGMGLDDSFFAVSKIDPNAAVKCNCAWDEGHEGHCDIVAANRILMSRQNEIAQTRAQKESQ